MRDAREERLLPHETLKLPDAEADEEDERRGRSERRAEKGPYGPSVTGDAPHQ